MSGSGAEPARRMTGGRGVILLGGFLVVVLAGLYIKSVYDERWMPPGPPQVAGRILMERKRCFRCHTVAGTGGEVGPNLTAIALKKSPQWLDRYLQDPKALKPKGRMPRPRLTDEQRAAVVAYLSTLEGSASARPGTPGQAAGAAP